MADANLATLAAVRETTLGTQPADGLQALRFTKESLGNKKETVKSAEIRGDRQVADSALVFSQPAGAFDFEVSFGMLVPMIEQVMLSDWNYGSVTANATFSAGAVSAPAGTFDDLPVGAIVRIAGTPSNDGNYRVYAKTTDGSGIQVWGSNFANGTVNGTTFAWKTITNGRQIKSLSLEKQIPTSDGGIFTEVFRGMMTDTLDLTIETKKIVTATATMIGTSYAQPENPTDPQAAFGEYASGIFTFTGQPSNNDYINIGVSQGGRQYVFTTGDPDTPYMVKIGVNIAATLASLMAAINGTATAGVGADMPRNALCSAGLGSGNTLVITALTPGAQGNEIQISESASTCTVSGATLTGGIDPVTGYLPAGNDPLVNGSSNFGGVRMNGMDAQDHFKSVKLKISNNLRGKDACGTVGNFDIGLGQFNVTGNLNAYFRDATLPDKSNTHASFGLEFYIENAYGARLYFHLPSLKTTGEPTIEGVSTDVMLDAAFEAVVGDNLTGRMLIIDHYDVD